MNTFHRFAVALLSAIVAPACFAQSSSGTEVANGAVSSSRAVAVVADSSVIANSAVADNSTSPANSPAETNDRGFTFTTSITGNHDSSSGWSNIVDSSARYDFNRVFGVELGMPYYMSHNGYSSTVVTRINVNPPLVTTYNSLGDLYLKLHFAAPDTNFGYNATITGTAPTGDTSTGISTGRPTFDLNNHFEHGFAFLTPFAELGIGDSSALINHRVRRPYTTLGPISHYKAGASFDFLKFFNFEGSAYEDLPIGDQKVFSHLFVPSKTGRVIRTINGKTRRFARTTVDTGQGILEDNGLSSELTVNVGQHMALTGSYERSLRQSMDTVAVGMSFTFGRAAQEPSGQ